MLHITFGTTAHDDEQEHIKIVNPGPLLERDAAQTGQYRRLGRKEDGHAQTRGVSGTDTGATVLDGLVRARELGEVVANHLGLDFDRVEDLTGHSLFMDAPSQRCGREYTPFRCRCRQRCQSSRGR